MTTSHLEILVEEPSMETFLRNLLPRILEDRVTFEVYPFSCKNELLERLPQRLRGYEAWLPSEWRIVIVIDVDDDNCVELKQRLEGAISDAGLTSRTSSGPGQPWQVVSRMAIEELESWYFGDWNAVCRCYPGVSRSIPAQAKYRDPDAITGGTWEAFQRLLQRAGYYKTGLPKIEVARKLGGVVNTEHNRSRSFCLFRDTLQEVIGS